MSFALLGFAIATSCSPGPNNLMVMASGANFGLRKTLPHMLGIAVGFCALIFVMGIGLMVVFEKFPMIQNVLLVLSIAYLLWLAWKIASAKPANKAQGGSRPFSFLQAVSFQWVNPKAWAMAVSANTIYAPNHDLASVLLVVLVFGFISLPNSTMWVSFGVLIQRWLGNGRALRVFNVTMALLLILSFIPMIIGYDKEEEALSSLTSEVQS